MTKTTQEALSKQKERSTAMTEVEILAQVEAEAARAIGEEEALARAEQEARVKAELDAQAKAEEETRVKAEQVARVRAAQEAEARTGGKEIANFQELGIAPLESTTSAVTALAARFETIAAETIDYSKKSLQNGSAFVEKLLGAKSFESAIHIRSEYAKTSYADFVAYLTKMGGLYAKLAKEACDRRSRIG
jgi:membrane protein involved in colicin uptake